MPDKTPLHAKPRGVTASSYGLLVGLIGIVALAAITTSGSSINELFGETAGALDQVVVEEATPAVPTPTAEPTPSPLFSFSSHTFTPCGQTGRTGPSESACETAYSGEAWATNNTFFTVSSGIQIWTVPQTGDYRIRAIGAAGGQSQHGNPGLGADIAGTFSLTEGDQLKILVGQRGTSNTGENCDSGGGGGSFVTDISDNPLVIAGGGGGGGTNTRGSTSAHGANGSASELSQTPTCTGGDVGPSPTGGNGATASCCSLGSGGGGLLTNGATSNHGANIPGGTAFVNGGTGGAGNDANANGGFGGGGAGHGNCHIGSGPGGGYNGGVSSEDCGGGGGGSFNSGSSPNASGGINSGAGSVEITLL